MKKKENKHINLNPKQTPLFYCRNLFELTKKFILFDPQTSICHLNEIRYRNLDSFANSFTGVSERTPAVFAEGSTSIAKTMNVSIHVKMSTKRKEKTTLGRRKSRWRSIGVLG